MNEAVLTLMRRVPGLQQLLLLVGLAAAIAGGIGAYMWLRGPDYTTAFTSLSAADAAQVTQALAQSGIPYRLTTGGEIQVPSKELMNARMQLGAKGLPNAGDGIDSLSKGGGFGISQFMENARYNHALESDLARTIGNLSGVSRAYVHVAQPKPSPFIGDQGQTSASVLVQLAPGAHLDPSQVSAIVQLVASSIPNLQPSHVTVVDQAGQLLSQHDADTNVGRIALKMQLTRNYEQYIDQKVTKLLTPIVGDGRVRVQAQADMDYSQAEEASETFHPDPKAIRSESVSSHSGGGGGLPQGVPGAFSNQPETPAAKTPAGTQPVPANANAPAAASSAAMKAAAAAIPRSSSESRQFAVGRSIKHVAETEGRLKRLTVAVLIDDQPKAAPVAGTNAKAAATSAPVALTGEQLQSIQTLVQSAVGYDQGRGDVVTVVNTRFLEQPDAALPKMAPPPWWKNTMVFDLLRNGIAIIALLVIGFFVVRPTLRSLMGGRTPEATQVALATPEADALADGSEPRALGGPAAPTPSRSYETKLETARKVAAEDPKRVAQVVRTWVGKNA
ncbi:MAG TPA: flagellar basal-body MS-ring/collar protein FliF [Nevskiaceae bacterium]